MILTIAFVEFCSGFLRQAIMQWYPIFAKQTGIPDRFVPANWGMLLCVAGILGGVFAGLPEEIEAGRYHSLAAVQVPDTLDVTAWTEDGEVMAVRHRELPVVGIQFHPESVLTPDGPTLGRNFLEGRL